MLYFCEFRYDGVKDSEPIIYSYLPTLVADLIEWEQMVGYIMRQFRSTSRLEKKISPNQLAFENLDREMLVYRIVSQVLPEEIIVYGVKD